MTTALQGGEWSASRPGRCLPPGKTRYPLYRRLGGAQGRSGQVRKISPSPGFDPRTVQPVASPFTDYATRLTNYRVPLLNILLRRYLNIYSKCAEHWRNGSISRTGVAPSRSTNRLNQTNQPTNQITLTKPHQPTD